MKRDIKEIKEALVNLIRKGISDGNLSKTLKDNRTDVEVRGKIYSLRLQELFFNKMVSLALPDEFGLPFYVGDFSKGSINRYLKECDKQFIKNVDNVDAVYLLKMYDDFHDIMCRVYPEIGSNKKGHSYVEMYNDLVKEYPDDRISNTDKVLISHKTLSQVFIDYSYIFDEETFITFDGLLVFEKIANINDRCNEIIRKGRFNSRMNIFEINERRNEDGAYLVRKIIEHNIQPLADMLRSGAGMRYEQFVDTCVGLGVKPMDTLIDIKDKTRLSGSFIYPHLLSASYLRGLTTKEEMFVSVANGISSLAMNKCKMGSAGDLNKKMAIMAKIGKLHQDPSHDCGTMYRRKFTIKNEEDLTRVDNMYYTTSNGDTLIHADKDKHLIGETVLLRAAHLCNNIQHGGLCRKCTGEEMYWNNLEMPINGEPTNLGVIIATELGGLAQQSILSGKHNKVSKPLYPTYWTVKGDKKYKLSGIEVKMDFINHIYFRYKGEDVIPDKLELIEPEKRKPVYNDELGEYSNGIRITVDEEVFEIWSDTLFYIEDKYTEDREVHLKQMIINVGVGHTFLALSVIRSSKFSNDIEAFADNLDLVMPDAPLNTMYIVCASMIRTMDGKIPDFSIPNQELKMVSLDDAIKNSTIVNNLPIGYLKHLLEDINKYDITSNYYVDSDITLK